MCNRCGKPLCGCKEPKICGCEYVAEGTCVEYTGRPLPTIGINPNDNLNQVLRKIDDKILGIEFDMVNSFTGYSSGGKTEIYAGYGEGGVHTFKTMDVGPGINIKDSDGVIKLSISEEYIREKVLDYLTDLKLV